MTDPKLVLMIWVISFVIGVQFHERHHYWIGKLFGGKPEYSKRTLYFLTWETDFSDPNALSSRQVIFTSMIGYIFLTLLAFLAIIPGFPDQISHYGIVGFATGGSLISWYDGLGTQYPEQWKNLTSGEAIPRDCFDEKKKELNPACFRIYGSNLAASLKAIRSIIWYKYGNQTYTARYSHISLSCTGGASGRLS